MPTENDHKLELFELDWEESAIDGAKETLGLRLGDTESGTDTGVLEDPRKIDGWLVTTTCVEGCSEGWVSGWVDEGVDEVLWKEGTEDLEEGGDDMVGGVGMVVDGCFVVWGDDGEVTCDGVNEGDGGDVDGHTGCLVGMVVEEINWLEGLFVVNGDGVGWVVVICGVEGVEEIDDGWDDNDGDIVGETCIDDGLDDCSPLNWVGRLEGWEVGSPDILHEGWLVINWGSVGWVVEISCVEGVSVGEKQAEGSRVGETCNDDGCSTKVGADVISLTGYENGLI